MPTAMDDLLKNLAALHSGLKLTGADFKGKGAWAAVMEVLHFLYCKHKGEKAVRTMSNIWPVQAGEGEKMFRDKIACWVRELQDNPEASAYVRGFTPALLLRPKTKQCVDFLFHLSLFVLQEKLSGECELELAWRGPGSEMPLLDHLECAVETMAAQNSFLEGSLDEAEAEEAWAERLLKEQNEDLEVRCRLLRKDLQAELGKGDEDKLKELFHKVQADFQHLLQVGELVEKIAARTKEEDHIVDCAAHVDEAAQATTETGDVDLVRFFSKCVEIKDEMIARLDDKEWDQLRQISEKLEEKLSRAQGVLDQLRERRAAADVFQKQLNEQVAAVVASLEADKPDDSPGDEQTTQI